LISHVLNVIKPIMLVFFKVRERTVQSERYLRSRHHNRHMRSYFATHFVPDYSTYKLYPRKPLYLYNLRLLARTGNSFIPIHLLGWRKLEHSMNAEALFWAMSIFTVVIRSLTTSTEYIKSEPMIKSIFSLRFEHIRRLSFESPQIS